MSDLEPQANPKRPDPRAQLRLLVDQQRLREALSLCEQSRAAQPQDAWLATMYAYVAQRLGMATKAAEAASEAIHLGSADPAAPLVLGVALNSLGRHAEAAETLLTAYRQLPKHVGAACALLEATTLAHGLDRARPLMAEIASNISDRTVASWWAKLLFNDRLDEELPAERLSAPLFSAQQWLAHSGQTPDWCGERERILLEEPKPNASPDPAGVRTTLPGYVPYAATLCNVTIFHRSNCILTADGAVLNETAADETFGRDISFGHDKLVLGRRGDRLLLDVGAYQIAEFDAGMMLSGSASQHFGHWVPEFLCKLYYFEHHPRFQALPIIVDSQMPPQHLEYLRLLVPNPIVQIPPGGGLLCKELLVAGPATFFPVQLSPNHQVPPEHQGGFSLPAMRHLQERVLCATPAPSSVGRKLYLSRRARGGRKPLNEAELAAALTAKGFETVYLENESFQAQVELFRSASIVVAPGGSTVLNMIFAPNTAKLFILSQKGLFNWGTYYGLMRELGYYVTFVCSDEDNENKHSNYTAAVDRLLTSLDRAGG